tara:strand:- start:169 stop:435 length:267 start_codon:yes stop_codon:yes gene_type:complete
MKVIKYYLIFVWVELIVLFAVGCSGPRERRGDWMEYMNDHQFNFNAPMMHWDRHNYYSLEELQQMWEETYNKAISDLDKVIEENEDIH